MTKDEDGVLLSIERDREPRPKLLLTLEEAADVLSIGRTKLYELIGSGTLASIRIDRSRRIPVTALIEFVHRLEHEQRYGSQRAAASSPT